MKRSMIPILCAAALVPGVFSSCSDGDPVEPADECLTELAELENDIRSDLEAAITDADFTLAIESAGGNAFSYSTGSSSGTVPYRSASTSKLVTAVIILSLVADGTLSLADHPQDHISTWPTTGNLASIELTHLLSFTSGLVNEPLCINLPNSDFESCVGEIADLNGDSSPPGAGFFYSSAHLQVAGLMAIKAAGLSSWQEVFERFKAETGLFAGADYDLPSLQNPRLAGGMHWSAEEYLGLLAALYNNQILTPELISRMTHDQIGDAVVENSPALDALGEDWHYGFGNWIECHANPHDCTQTTRVSSPGAYGAYPFIDFDHGYYGILAREGALGTFDRGYELFETMATKLEAWASLVCD